MSPTKFHDASRVHNQVSKQSLTSIVALKVTKIHRYNNSVMITDSLIALALSHINRQLLFSVIEWFKLKVSETRPCYGAKGTMYVQIEQKQRRTTRTSPKMAPAQVPVT